MILNCDKPGFAELLTDDQRATFPALQPALKERVRAGAEQRRAAREALEAAN